MPFPSSPGFALKSCTITASFEKPATNARSVVWLSTFSTNFAAAFFSNEKRSFTEPLVSISKPRRNGKASIPAKTALPLREVYCCRNLNFGLLQVVDHVSVAAHRKENCHVINAGANHPHSRRNTGCRQGRSRRRRSFCLQRPSVRVDRAAIGTFGFLVEAV